MIRTLATVGLSILCLASAGCKVKQTQDAKLPEVHATGGQLPAYDVKGPEVKVSSKPATVDVPVVKIKTPQ
jgi:hypothetical protein